MFYTGCTVLQTIRTQIGLLECSFRRMSITRQSRIFVVGGGGGPGLTARKQPGQRCFFFFFLVLNLLYSLQRGSNGFISEKTILFQGSGRGPIFSKGGGGGGGGGVAGSLEAV